MIISPIKGTLHVKGSKIGEHQNQGYSKFIWLYIYTCAYAYRSCGYVRIYVPCIQLLPWLARNSPYSRNNSAKYVPNWGVRIPYTKQKSSSLLTKPVSHYCYYTRPTGGLDNTIKYVSDAEHQKWGHTSPIRIYTCTWGVRIPYTRTYHNPGS